MASTPEQIVEGAMFEVAPERRGEMRRLWTQYKPQIEIVSTANLLTLNANGRRIEFDPNIWDVFWLIGFSAWRAIEAYAPHVSLSANQNRSLADLFAADDQLGVVEWDYRAGLAAAQRLIAPYTLNEAPWPPTIPRPTASRNSLTNAPDQVAFDLCGFAVVGALLHELHHVMLDQDKRRPSDRREEELMCDVWARDYMTAKLARYARLHGHAYRKVLEKRSMGLALLALILHEITPQWAHGGTTTYFSIADRFTALIDNTRLPSDSVFWLWTASLLVGVCRQRSISFDIVPTNACELTRNLIAKL